MMSYAIQMLQQSSSIDEGMLIGEEFIAAEEEVSQESYVAKGSLTTYTKQYTFVKVVSSPIAKEMTTLVAKWMASTDKKSFSETNIFSLARSAPSSSYPPLSHSASRPVFSQKSAPPTSFEKPGQSSQIAAPKTFSGKPSETTQRAPLVDGSKSRLIDASKSSQERSTRASSNQEFSLFEKRWTHEETLSWWQMRYHKRDHDKGGQHHSKDQHEQDEEDTPSKKSKKVLLEGASSKGVSVNTPSFSSRRRKKPQLPTPKLGVFALYYILTKMGIFADGVSNFANKKEVESIDAETTETHQKRLKEMKEAIDKERSSTRWSIAVKTFSWIGSLFSIISGIALVVTGVGAVAGAMLIAGGVIQVTNQILEVSGGWHKIAELLPGDSSAEKKRSIIAWMQIGITVLCLVLSAVGIIWGGFKSFGEGMQIASGMIGGIAAGGHGVGTIGEGVASFMYRNKLSEVRRYDILLASLKHRRHDLMEKMEWRIERLEQLFEDLASSLEFDIELFRSDQLINRR